MKALATFAKGRRAHRCSQQTSLFRTFVVVVAEIVRGTIRAVSGQALEATQVSSRRMMELLLLLLENHANLLVVFRLVSWCRFLFHVSGGKDLLVRGCVLDESGCIRVGGSLESPRMCPVEPRMLDTTSLLLLLLLLLLFDASALGGRLITLEPFWLDHG